jgi:hypothetical protein
MTKAKSNHDDLRSWAFWEETPETMDLGDAEDLVQDLDEVIFDIQGQLASNLTWRQKAETSLKWAQKKRMDAKNRIAELKKVEREANHQKFLALRNTEHAKFTAAAYQVLSSDQIALINERAKELTNV